MNESLAEDGGVPMGLKLHRPVKSWVQITAACNMACRQCYGNCRATPPAEELDSKQFIEVLGEMADAGVVELLVEGGEPLARPDLLEILKTCTPRMLIRLRTNATLLTPVMARELKQAGIGSLLVDFMGATPETHDWHYQTSGAFHASRQGFEYASIAGLNPAPLLIMTRRNVAELQAFVDMCVELGAQRIGILRLYPIGRAREYWGEMALTLEEQMDALATLKTPPGIHLMRSWHPRDANCCWQASGITSTGRSVGCSYLREFVNFGSVRSESFLTTWNHPHAQHLRRREVTSYCPECAATQGSQGGCRSTAYAFTGDWDAPDPFCTTTNGGINVSILPPRRDSQSG